MLSVATWNINSARLRIGLIEKLLGQAAPDILCLQEIKCESHLFPAEALAAMGYVHQAISGQKGYHGVATVSRVPIREIARRDWQANGEARHIAVEVEGRGLTIDNVYVPAGGDVPDREVNPKFGQKLDFLDRMTRWSEQLDRPTLLVGDFNIAPLESDVWSHKQLLKVVSHTPIEVATLGRLQAAHGWADLGRQFVPDPARYYSWWSYRNPNWQTNDKGRRLDHMWASPAVAAQARAHSVIEEARTWEKPSDHVPLITEFDL